MPRVFTTWSGWSLLITGTVVGGLFAAFAFAVSVFAMPMMLEEKTDALTAMGISLSLVWNNLSVMLVWGTIVVGLFAISVLTGFVGLIVIFPCSATPPGTPTARSASAAVSACSSGRSEPWVAAPGRPGCVAQARLVRREDLQAVAQSAKTAGRG